MQKWSEMWIEYLTLHINPAILIFNIEAPWELINIPENKLNENILSAFKNNRINIIKTSQKQVS